MVGAERVRSLRVEEAEALTLEILTPMKMKDMSRDPNHGGRNVTPTPNARAKRRIRVYGEDRMVAFARWM